jgi:hypothetical protein
MDTGQTCIPPVADEHIGRQQQKATKPDDIPLDHKYMSDQLRRYVVKGADMVLITPATNFRNI